MPNPVDTSLRPVFLDWARPLRALAARIKRVAPSGLFGRSALLLAAPLIVSQAVGMWVFYDRLWSTVVRRLSDATAADIALLVEGHRSPRSQNGKDLLELIDSTTEMRSTFLPARTLAGRGLDMPGSAIEQSLGASLIERNVGPFEIDSSELPRHLLIRVQAQDGLQQIAVPRDRLYSPATYVFLLWMAGTALITLALAMLALRGQVSALKRLALAADAFGRGLDAPQFTPQGAIEVRQAANAFLTMRQRIRRQVKQRTEMLAAISHDLRTPLTRMRLELATLEDNEGLQAIQSDIVDMQKMLEAYLSFARSEDNEKTELVSLAALVRDAVASAQREGAQIVLNDLPDLDAPVRPIALKRCLDNLIGNAARYGGRAWVTMARARGSIDIVIDDSGPGIPAPMREAVFQPFFRLEHSRNTSTGGVGLGLTIARDVMLAHGGNLTLEDSPYGGLRARATLPTADIFRNGP